MEKMFSTSRMLEHFRKILPLQGNSVMLEVQTSPLADGQASG